MTINGNKVVKLTVGRVSARYDKNGHLSAQRFGVIAFTDKGASVPVADLVAEECADAEERKRLNALMRLGTRAACVVVAAQLAEGDKSIKLAKQVKDNLTEAQASVDAEKKDKAEKRAAKKAAAKKEEEEKATGEYQMKKIAEIAAIKSKDESVNKTLGAIGVAATKTLATITEELLAAVA